MTGHLVPRKGGWDCHGLPVELEVEKEIGTTGKRDIEAFGIAEFNRLCRESVTRYVGEFERLTDRIGFWIDMSDAYWTMNTEYIESVWWSLKQLHERGLLVESDKVTAYCPRCGTALSDAEVAMGYQTVEDPSVFVRFRACSSAIPGLADLVGASLLGWTTTPWTLPSNDGPRRGRRRATYVVVERDGERLVLGARAARARARRRRERRRDAPRSRPRRGPLPSRSYPNVEGAHDGRRRRLRLDGRRHRDRAHGAGVRARGPGGRPRAGAGRCSSRSTTPAGSTTWRRRSSAGSS